MDKLTLDLMGASIHWEHDTHTQAHTHTAKTGSPRPNLWPGPLCKILCLKPRSNTASPDSAYVERLRFTEQHSRLQIMSTRQLHIVACPGINSL